MFDIGFWEIMFILLIALVVVGPERLPKLAYTAGKWVGKARSMLSSVKGEIDKEIKAEELKRVLEEQKKSLNPIEEIVEETGSTVHDLADQTRSSLADAERKVSGTGDAQPPQGDGAVAADPTKPADPNQSVPNH